MASAQPAELCTKYGHFLPGIAWEKVEQSVVTAQHDRRPGGAALRLARLREGH
jgi:hypothetical protein